MHTGRTTASRPAASFTGFATPPRRSCVRSEMRATMSRGRALHSSWRAPPPLSAARMPSSLVSHLMAPRRHGQRPVPNGLDALGDGVVLACDPGNGSFPSGLPSRTLPLERFHRRYDGFRSVPVGFWVTATGDGPYPRVGQQRNQVQHLPLALPRKVLPSRRRGTSPPPVSARSRGSEPSDGSRGLSTGCFPMKSLNSSR